LLCSAKSTLQINTMIYSYKSNDDADNNDDDDDMITKMTT